MVVTEESPEGLLYREEFVGAVEMRRLRTASVRKIDKRPVLAGRALAWIRNPGIPSRAIAGFTQPCEKRRCDATLLLFAGPLWMFGERKRPLHRQEVRALCELPMRCVSSVS